MKIDIILADDHPALLAGIKHELSGIPTLNVVGSAGSSTELVQLLGKLSCDLLVTDYSMPGGEFGDGMALLSFLRRRFPDLKIIVFSMLDNPAMVREMSRLGIKSVLSKADDLGHLISAIHAVFAGSTYFSPSTRATGEFQIKQEPHQGMRQLTMREAEVVRLFIAGQSINEIAAQLHRSKQTVSAQKMSAMRKFGIERDVDLFRYAHEMGLVGAPAPDPTQKN
ncbi:response regulator transcription factor [Variovorax soli]|uniref:response regulator transcription factor n=1 Tax=Variovorax soli TaxID=376815 RepID=UPI000838C013|nr:response regulator transcription factor [Variovorax soli]